jgi:hypothetical protein
VILPNRKIASIPRVKLTNYLLSLEHPVGGSKAKFFRKIGFDDSNVDKLKQALLTIAIKNNVEKIVNLGNQKELAHDQLKYERVSIQPNTIRNADKEIYSPSGVWERDLLSNLQIT